MIEHKCYTGTRESFRPYVRVQQLDLLLTTEQTVKWWDPNNNIPILAGLVQLIVLMLAGSSSEFFQFSLCKSLELLPKTGWKEYYDKAGHKYESIVTSKKRRDPSYEVPMCTDPKKMYGKDEDILKVYS